MFVTLYVSRCDESATSALADKVMASTKRAAPFLATVTDEDCRVFNYAAAKDRLVCVYVDPLQRLLNLKPVRQQKAASAPH